jgi:hypothetical protein
MKICRIFQYKAVNESNKENELMRLRFFSAKKSIRIQKETHLKDDLL